MAGDGATLLRPVALMGFMGAGKSTVGRILADFLAVPFQDLDDLVSARTGQTIPELFRTGGEDRFRREESAALQAALSPVPTVWALGGGTVIQPANGLFLRDMGVVLVWLQVDWPTTLGRVATGSRPLLAAGPEAGRALLRERWALYAQWADFAVDGSGPAARVAEQVLVQLKERHHVA